MRRAEGVIFILLSALTLTLTAPLLAQPSHVFGTETPLREGPMMPPSPSTPTTPPATAGGQTQLPPLPSPTETKDAQGNTRMVLKDVKMLIEQIIPKDATNEEKERLRGFIAGYYFTVKNPDAAEKYASAILAKDNTLNASRNAQVGFLVGVEAAMPVRDLIRDTLEAMGVPLLPTPQTQPEPPSPPTPKTPTGPKTPL
jgi:hypothetical protein